MTPTPPLGLGNGQGQAAVGSLLVVGSARGAVPAFRQARFPGPPSEPGVRVATHRALHEARLDKTHRSVALALGSAVPGLDSWTANPKSERRYSPATPALPIRRGWPAVPLRHVHASRVLGLRRARRHDPPPTADDTPARRPKAGRAATGRFPRSPPPGRRGRCPAPARPRQPSPGVRRSPSPWPPHRPLPTGSGVARRSRGGCALLTGPDPPGSGPARR